MKRGKKAKMVAIYAYMVVFFQAMFVSGTHVISISTGKHWYVAMLLFGIIAATATFWTFLQGSVAEEIGNVWQRQAFDRGRTLASAFKRKGGWACAEAFSHYCSEPPMENWPVTRFDLWSAYRAGWASYMDPLFTYTCIDSYEDWVRDGCRLVHSQNGRMPLGMEEVEARCSLCGQTTRANAHDHVGV